MSDVLTSSEIPVERSPETPGRGRAVLIAVALTVVGLVVGTVFGAVPVIYQVVQTGDLALSSSTLVASVVLTMVGYALVGGLYARRYLGGVPLRVPTLSDTVWVIGGTVVALISVTALSVLLMGAGIEAAPNSIGVIGAGSPSVFLTLAVVAVLFIGPAEELLFRGAIQGRLRRAFGSTGAVLGASALFAVIHAFAVVGSLGATVTSVAIIGIVSLVLGIAYERTRNLVVPALVHGFYNAVLLVTAYVTLA
jgi:hypothetical protein